MNEQTSTVLRRLEEEDRRDREDGTPQSRRLRSVSAEVWQFLHLLVPIPRGELLCRKTSKG